MAGLLQIGSTTVLRTKQRGLLFIAALIVILGVILFVLLSEGRPVAVTADGRRIAIEKVTFGTHHSFTQGKWWVRLLSPIRGKRWAAQRGSYEVRITNNVPALMVWTRWEGLYRSNVAIEAAILDERGTESEVVRNRWNAIPRSLGSNAQPAYVAWLFNNLPRRSDKIRLRIYDRDRQYAPTQVVEIAFSNPVRERIPEWRGSALPLVITTNSAQFALTSVQRASNALWRFNFVVRTNGQPDYSWLVGGVTASGASGNILSARSNLDTTATTNLTFQLGGALWPEEPVWRFAAEFFRTADFQPNELWTLTNIAIPTRALPFHLTTNFVSHDNRPAAFTLESVPSFRPGVRRNANVSVRFEAADLHLFLLDASDDRGRQINFEVDRGVPRMVYLFGLAIPAGAQSVNLTFAIRKATVITFDVAAPGLTRTGPR